MEPEDTTISNTDLLMQTLLLSRAVWNTETGAPARECPLTAKQARNMIEVVFDLLPKVCPGYQERVAQMDALSSAQQKQVATLRFDGVPCPAALIAVTT